AGDDLGQAAHLGVQHLDREALAHVGVLGLVDGPHAALADEAFDEVTPAQRDADEQLGSPRPHARSLGLRRGRGGSRPGLLPVRLRGGVYVQGRAHRRPSMGPEGPVRYWFKLSPRLSESAKESFPAYGSPHPHAPRSYSDPT